MRLLPRTVLLFWLLMAIGTVAQAQAPPSPLITVGTQSNAPWLPDLYHPGQRVAVSPTRQIDVLILGDGYTSRSRFEKDVRQWYDDFSSITPWKQTVGLFRVRGVWTPSVAQATPAKRSYYGLPASRTGVGVVDAPGTRRKIWGAVETTGANPALTNDGYMSHTVIVMLVRTAGNYKASGKSRVIVAPDNKRRVRVAFGNYTHHEFAHAFSRLEDEYIGSPGKRSSRRQPGRVSLFSVSNIAHTRDPARLPWAHLMAGSAINPDKNSVIGWCWIGGEYEYNAYHSEPFCLMNGGSSNWNRDKTARTGWWRSTERFCFWCEEIAIARLWQRAGLLGDGKDGYELWKQWESGGRAAYQRTFDVAERIEKRNAMYTKNKMANTTLYELPAKSADEKSESEPGDDTENVSDPLEDAPAPPTEPSPKR